MPDAGAVRVADEDAVAGDAEAAAIAGAVEVAAAPRARRRIALGRDERHPVNVLEVAEQEEPLLELEGACLRVRFRGTRIDLALPVHAHRRHLGHRRVEGARLAAGGILGVVNALLVGGKHGPAEAGHYARYRVPHEARAQYEPTAMTTHNANRTEMRFMRVQYTNSQLRNDQLSNALEVWEFAHASDWEL